MKLSDQLEIAISIAVEAHKGQTDKADIPYILHPLRVMNNVDSLEAKIVAVLHDVVEDTPATFDFLLEKGIDKHLVDTLRLLTHEKDIAYEDYIQKITTNPLAIQVKLADLKDNSNLDRLKNRTDKDCQRLEKYKKAIAFLGEYLI